MIVTIKKPSNALLDYMEDVVPKQHFYTEVQGNGKHHIVNEVHITTDIYHRDPYRQCHYITINGKYGSVHIDFEDSECAGVEVRRSGL